MKVKFEYIILAILIALLSLLGISGYYAYKNFSTIIATFSEESKPDQLLIKIKSISNLVQKAENGAKTYRLTEDTAELVSFYQFTHQADSSLTALQSYVDTEESSKDVDRYAKLIKKKFIYLEVFSKSSQIYRGPEALENVLNELNSASIETEDDSDDERSFIDRILRRRKNDGYPGLDQGNITEEIEQLKSEEQLREEMAKAADDAILGRIDSLSTLIKELQYSMELRENNRIAEGTEKADDAMTTTNRDLQYFLVSIGLLLVLTAFLVLNNLKQNRRYRRTLQRSKEMTESMAKERERFFASMSHELRTPLNAIHGFSEQIDRSQLDDNNKEKVNMISSASGHLNKLVDQLLDHSKLQANKLILDAGYFSLAGAIEESLGLASSLLSDDQDLVSKLSIERELLVLGDKQRLVQIILNLLSNAIRFCPHGGISLNADAAKQDKELILLLDVNDEGIGMTPDQLLNVFGEFEQANVSTSTKYGGTGLGLTIVKQLVDLHKGDVKVRSEVDKGTTFSIRIPYPEFKYSVPKAPKAATPLPFNSILVADDELYNRKLIGNILSKHDLPHEFAHNGEEVLQKLESQEFDLVLMDIQMPKMNGVETLQMIRNADDLVLRSTPCIAISAAISEEDLKQLKQLKVNGVIPKPFKEAELLEAMAHMGMPDRIANQVEDLQPTSQKISFENLRDLSGTDDAFYLDMLQTFKKNMDEGLQLLSDLIDTGDNSNLAANAHRLCSPCRHLKCYDLLDQLKALERSATENDAQAAKENLDGVRNIYDEIMPILGDEIDKCQNKI